MTLNRRLHITGCPRSGTTLLMEQLSTCFAHSGRCKHERSIFDNEDLPAGLYVSKQPNDIRQLRHIFPRDEQLFIIYVYRDPRDVITSKHLDDPERYFCNYRIWKLCERAAARYEGHSRFLRLSYEDLVTNPDGVQSRIATRFPFLQKKGEFSRFYQHAKPAIAAQKALSGLRPVDSNNLSRWQQHLPRIAHQLGLHPELADDLIRLNYERDRRWLQALEGTTGIAYPCRYPESRRLFREWEKAVRVYLKSRRYLQRLNGSR